jgi:hypothetical protein
MIKNFKIFEAKRLSNKSLINAIYDYLVNALPSNFSAKIWTDGTLNIYDSNVKRNKGVVAYFYINRQLTEFTLSLNSRTFFSNANLIQEFILEKFKQSRIPIDFNVINDDTDNFNRHCYINFNINFFENVISFFEELNPEDLILHFSTTKYNL